MLVLKLYGPNSALRCTHNSQRFQGEQCSWMSGPCLNPFTEPICSSVFWDVWSKPQTEEDEDDNSRVVNMNLLQLQGPMIPSISQSQIHILYSDKSQLQDLGAFRQFCFQEWCCRPPWTGQLSVLSLLLLYLCISHSQKFQIGLRHGCVD